ncbi:MAG TPA: sigma-70 family RNA polymerase sigma factor [Candidatus Scybalocola faecigallinarum]|uniref:RNA polymerase sigma factor SigS n=1 Tax=Candidatus Scybalocola faecigallinarum TaxID=2840941 RepID=A0A9D1F4U8_9FIRM|nr:sigma-70 family RNA polymerase sigma factor [Candidatus Scybalocola faecigallinarum]
MDSQFNEMTDEQICRCIQQGQTAGIDYLLNKYKGMAKKKARQFYLIGGESDDLIQEGMIGLMKAIWDYDPDIGTDFAGFAQLCMIRQISSAVRAAQRQKHQPLNSYVSLYEPADDDENAPVLMDTLSESGAGPEDSFFIKENRERARQRLLDALSPLEKKVLDLFMEGQSYSQIARQLNKNEKAVDNAIQRIRKKAEALQS